MTSMCHCVQPLVEVRGGGRGVVSQTFFPRFAAMILLISVSLVAGVIGMNHCTWLIFFFKSDPFFQPQGFTSAGASAWILPLTPTLLGHSC
jgi:hypothetical protein